MPKFYLKTFGCAQNTADSERIKAFYQHKGWQEVVDWKKADEIIINSCIVRESAENRVYGLINNIRKNSVARKPKIILTGCLAAVAKQIKGVDEILPINQITTAAEPLRCRQKTALISITSGCNHFCSYCIVPYTRGREVSRPSKEILKEIDQAIKNGFKEILLIGQNVNSWNNNKFPQLLETIANRPLNKISFVSSNPWKFSDELIKVIARHNNIDRLIHLPLQSGDDKILKKMNRGYTAADYLNLIEKIKSKVKNSKFSTDIIVGFPGEDEKAFQNTVKLCRRVGFEIAYINKYSPRPGTISAKIYPDNVPQTEKKRRWKILNELINK
ncbi:MAG TPA: MiaB/RimO family radical SAM methylthiotransferase [Candidatus Woesebacteria bacterium]|nr:MiaB/RimO family radical SAM methylthiotransferase [Candidatus Woesebacteria bacterium]